MKSSWKEVLLEDIADEITVGFVGSMSSEYVESGIPFLRSLNVEPFDINTKELKYVSAEFHQKIKKSGLNPGDVVIVRTGKPGACTVIPNWLPEANCSDLVIVRPGSELDPYFLSSYINYVATHYVNSHLVGAVQQHFNVGSARKLKILLPPLEEQKAIAKKLNNLNEKIEINNSIIKTLEDIAQTLFKRWLIDFDFPNENGDPYRTSGGIMVESEMGLIPKGWEVLNLNQFVGSVSQSIDKKSKQYAIFLNTSDILEGQVLKDDYSATSKMPGQAKKLIKKNDILFSEIRPANKRFAYIDFDAEDYVVSTKLMVLRTDDDIFSSRGTVRKMRIYNVKKIQT